MAGTQPLHTIWIISCGRVGDLKQMQALAQALGWPTEIHTLERERRGLFDTRRLMAEANERMRKLPPPAIILSAEGAAAEASLQLKRRHPGIKSVCLARPRGHFDDFDLIITTPQYRLAPAANILEITLPLTSPAAAPHAAAGAGVALLVGGTSPPYVIDAAAAAEMAAGVREYAERKKLALSGTTSARTGKDAAEALVRGLGNSATFHVWEKGKPNPYAELLALAGEFIVTADSVSMLADAIATGKPVSIYPLREKWNTGQRLVRALWTMARKRDSSLPARLLWPLFNSGLLEARADRGALHQTLLRRGLVSWFGEKPAPPATGLFEHDMQDAVRRVHGLFAGHET